MIRRAATGALAVLLLAFPAAAPAPASAGAGVPARPTPIGMPTADPGDDPGGRETWGVVPSGAKGPDGRPAFTYEVEPGATVQGVVRVLNYSARPLVVTVYAADAAVTNDGGFDLVAADVAPQDVAAWTSVQGRELTIPSRAHRDVGFRIEVPRDAEPGDHVGGLVAARTAGATTGSDGRVAVERRVGARVYLRVAGELDPELTVTDVSADFAGSPVGLPGPTRVRYTVRNDGNVRVAGRPRIRVAGPLGLVGKTATGNPLPELLPGGSVTHLMEVPGTWPLVRLGAEVEVRPDSSGNEVLPARWPAARGSAAAWALPWLPLGLGLAGAGVVGHRRVRRWLPSRDIGREVAVPGGHGATPNPPF